MATNYETLLLTKEGGKTTITFNRPEKRNAMSPQLHREMFELLTELRYDKETRVIVLTGAGESFCAGPRSKTVCPRVGKPTGAGARRGAREGPALAQRDAANFTAAGYRSHHWLVSRRSPHRGGGL